MGESVVLGYAVVVLSVWLCWEVIKVPLELRAPSFLAIRLAPGSPEVLRRAAESELAAGRLGNAEALSRESVAKAPFNARALRVLGLVTSREGHDDLADQMLTLAGNWSLRDDPTHAWLVQRRLRQGSYSSAFAHADTLARRRADLRDRVFNLFAGAAEIDSRALPPLVKLLAENPPWRDPFLTYLRTRKGGDGLLLNLAINLQRTSYPLTNGELQEVYLDWLSRGRLPAAMIAREHIKRPATTSLLQDGDFGTPVEKTIRPFGWQLGTGPGLSPEIVEDDLRARDLALRAAYDGYGTGVIAEQLLTLRGGRYVLSGSQRVEASGDGRFTWTLTCFEGDADLLALSGRMRPPEESEAWTTFSMSFEVPQRQCSAQWLRLQTLPGDRRQGVATWFDDISIRPVSARTGSSEQIPGPQPRPIAQR